MFKTIDEEKIMKRTTHALNFHKKILIILKAHWLLTGHITMKEQ